MNTRLNTGRKALPMVLGGIALASLLLLLVWNLYPGLFPAHAHDSLAAFPLAMIALALLLHRAFHRTPPWEMFKAMLLSSAFIFWAANQFWPSLPHAMFLNDLAIALFVLDIVFVIAGWPKGSN